MDEDTRFVIEFVAGQAVFVAALVHLTFGVINWARWTQAGALIPGDARWPAFVFSGGALILGLYVASHREQRRRFYAAGIVVMVGYIVGYFGWHLGGHRLLLIAGPAAGGTESITVEWFLDHLFAGPVEFGSIVVETLAAVLLAVLWVTAEESTDRPSA